MTRIAHLSDLHIGSHDPACVEALLASLDQTKPDIVVVSGDLTTAGRHSEFKSAAGILQQIKAPIVATPGNHDLPVHNLWERFTNPLGRYRNWIAPEAYTRYRSGSVALIAVTTARPWDLSWNWSHGRLSGAQALRVDQFMAANQHVPFRGVVVHHPFCVPEDMPGFRTICNAEPMLSVLARHRVNLVLAGHLHRSFVASRTVKMEHDDYSVPILQASTATSHRRRAQPNAYNLVTVDGHKHQVSQWVYDDRMFSEASTGIWGMTPGHQ